MDRILVSILDDKTHEELLSTHDLTLVKAIEICRAREAATIHMNALKNEEINKVKGTQKQKKPVKLRDRTKGKQHQTETTQTATKKCCFWKQHRTKPHVSVYRKSGRNAQTSVSVTYLNHGNAEINFLEICSCFCHVS